MIDYAHMKLYLLDPAKPLKTAGFTQVALDFNESGLSDVTVEVDGTVMSLRVDTGTTASASIDRAGAERAKLKMKAGNGKFVGVGGA